MFCGLVLLENMCPCVIFCVTRTLCVRSPEIGQLSDCSPGSHQQPSPLASIVWSCLQLRCEVATRSLHSFGHGSNVDAVTSPVRLGKRCARSPPKPNVQVSRQKCHNAQPDDVRNSHDVRMPPTGIRLKFHHRIHSRRVNFPLGKTACPEEVPSGSSVVEMVGNIGERRITEAVQR